jgi:hypothetical protein
MFESVEKCSCVDVCVNVSCPHRQRFISLSQPSSPEYKKLRIAKQRSEFSRHFPLVAVRFWQLVHIRTSPSLIGADYAFFLAEKLSSRTNLAPHSMQVQLHVVVRCLNWRMRERPYAVVMSKPRLFEDYIAGHNVRMRSECVGPHPRAQSNPLPLKIPRGSQRHLQGHPVGLRSPGMRCHQVLCLFKAEERAEQSLTGAEVDNQLNRGFFPSEIAEGRDRSARVTLQNDYDFTATSWFWFPRGANQYSD